MPVYNEEEIIDTVISSWINKLEILNIKYEFCVFNDGSRDSTLTVLERLKKIYPKLEVIDKRNSGHGPTILFGFQKAKSEWIFQIDSDNEMESIHFEKLWFQRNNFDFLVGLRENRESPIVRKIITFFSRLTINVLYGKSIVDVNSPYRLYRVDKFHDAFKKIPEDTFAPNVILSGYAARQRMRIFETPIPCNLRQTGEVSIKEWKLLKASIKSWLQTIKFRFMI